MGTLRYAILGLLNRKAMTGYDLSKEFQTSLAEFWHAKHSQIYPELKALAEDGLITFQTEITGTVLEKKVYSITQAGKAEFLQWERSKSKIKQLPKDEFKLRLFFSDSLPKEAQIQLLTNHLEQHQERLEQLHNDLSKFDAIPPTQAAAFSDYLVLLGAISREQSMCDWLKTCIALCEKNSPFTSSDRSSKNGQ